MRAALIAVAILLLAASPAAAAGRLHVQVVGQSHHPRVNAKWHYSVTVTDAKTGRRVACRIHLEFTFGGIAVGQVGTHTVKNGFWQETFGTPGNPPFPPASRAQRVTLTAIVTAKGYAKATGGWWVQPV